MRNAIFDHYEREFGIYFPEAVEFAKDEWKRDWRIAMDAQPSLITTPSSGIPAFLTTIVDPQILKILTAKNKAVEILGEVRKGDWTMETAMFPVIEHTGEISTYGDFNNNGRANANTNFPQRQSYLFQTIPEYGDRELDREGLAKINWASEVRESAVTVLNKFQNLVYFKGLAGLQNYGLQTDPSLPAPIAPSLKSWGGVGWWNGNVQAATPNEIYGDVLKKSFPKLRMVSAVQYGAVSAQNPQGIAAGELMQLIATKVEGQETGYCAFSEKLRAHPIVRDLSSFRQKLTQGVWGCVVRQPFAIAQMIGI